MKIILFVFIFFLVGVNVVYADKVLITFTERLDDVDFDGTWTFQNEWKPSSLVMVKNDGSNDNESFVYRIAHDYENLFVYVSATSDKTPNKSMDRAIVCIGENNNSRPTIHDFCFISIMGTNKVHTLQGGSSMAITGFYKTIDNHPELIGVGAISSQFDKYSKIPHSSYEFKIPLEIFERSDVYGLYVGVFDANTYTQYGWPPEAVQEKYPFIPSPQSWGELVSPDKTMLNYSS